MSSLRMPSMPGCRTGPSPVDPEGLCLLASIPIRASRVQRKLIQCRSRLLWTRAPMGRRWHEGAYSLKQKVISCHFGWLRKKFRSSSLVPVSASKASLGFPTRSQLHRRIYHLPRRRKNHSTTFEAQTLHSPLKWEMLGLNVASASVASSNF